MPTRRSSPSPASRTPPAREAICALRTDKTTSRASAPDADGELSGSEVAETAYAFSRRDLRLVVRRQREAAGAQFVTCHPDGTTPLPAAWDHLEGP